MNILALDLATKTGWALYENGRIESGVQDFSKQRGESNGMLFLKFNRWLHQMRLEGFHSPLDLIVFEQAHHRGGAATEIAVGLMTRVLEYGAAKAINHASVHSATLKKWATGSGRAEKSAMILAAVKWKYAMGGIGVSATVVSEMEALGRLTVNMDDNEADAILLLAYALEKFNTEGAAWNAQAAAVAEAK